MNKRRVIIYTAIVLLLGAGVCSAYYLYFINGPRSAHFPWTRSTSLSQERIGQLSLYQSMKELKPTPIPDRDNALYDYYTWRDGMKIATNKKDDKVIRIMIFSDKPTKKGIRVGDASDKVIQIYGKNYYKRSEQGFNVIGYVDKKLNRTLEFWFLHGKVFSIRLDIDSMD